MESNGRFAHWGGRGLLLAALLFGLGCGSVDANDDVAADLGGGDVAAPPDGGPIDLGGGDNGGPIDQGPGDGGLGDQAPPADLGGGDGSGPGDGVGPGDLPGGPDALPGDAEAGAPDTSPPSCETASELDCPTLPGCILELVGEFQYRCRAAENACEQLRDPETCAATAGCVFHPGFCYCPPDVMCTCAGGPPASCRAAGDLGPCRADDDWDCPDGYGCCGATAETLGRCLPTGQCGTAGCARRLVLRTDGGLCMDGACFREVRVGAGGYLFVDDETPFTPRDDALSAEWTAVFEAVLAAVDTESLEPGYGDCCNAYFDGSDLYVTFFGPGATERTTRISDGSLAPPELRTLVDFVMEAAEPRLADAPENPADFAACPGLADVPTGDGPPPSTCENAFELAGNNFVWTLDGPNGQHLDRDRIVLDGVDPAALPVMVTKDGVVTAVDPGVAFTLRAADGDWTLTFTAREPSVPGLCVVVGQSVRLTARVAWAFDLNIHGVMVSDERGVLFATDEGLSGVHEAPESPFGVAVTSAFCEPQTEPGFCGPRGAQELQFTAGGAALTLRTAEWGRLNVPGGYDLAVRNLRSFQTGYCDDNWNYAYVALAIAGSDRALCGDPGLPGCRGNDCAESEMCRRPDQGPICGNCFDPEPNCISDPDCAPEAVCEWVSGPCYCSAVAQCIPACLGSADCAEGETCAITGHCVAAPCEDDADCPLHFHCAAEGPMSETVCVRRTCTADAQCPGGFCVVGLCYDTLGHCEILAP